MKKAKKIGTITFHCSYNYGSVLQAFALQKHLESKGYEVSILDFVLKSDFEHYKLFRTNFYKKNIKYIVADLYLLRKNLKRKKSFSHFSNTFLKKTSTTYYDSNCLKEVNKTFDTFICGSDQIWNFDCTKGIEPAYFLEFADSDKLKIAYAPSLAHTQFDNLDTIKLKSLLERFDYLSVREKSTIPLISGLVNRPIMNTLDPTLLLESSDYKEIIRNYPVNGEFVFFYILEPNKEIITYCNELAKKHQLKIIILSKRPIVGLNNAKNVYGIEPGEFLYLIKEAKYVVTNSFHATVFSILFNRQFATFTTKKSGSRMVDLLSQLGLENRIVEQAFNMEASIDYQSVFNKLNQLRQSSKEFLNQALGEEE